MSGNITKITIGVGETVRLPVTLNKTMKILTCISRNSFVATCSNTSNTVSVTGRNPGCTLVEVIASPCVGQVVKQIFLVVVIEENEE